MDLQFFGGEGSGMTGYGGLKNYKGEMKNFTFKACDGSTETPRYKWEVSPLKKRECSNYRGYRWEDSLENFEISHLF